MTDGPPALTVWYDGACPLCLREIALMRRLDRARRIEFLDAAGDAAADAAGASGTFPIDRAELLTRFHARENGVMLQGAAAFAAMWRAIPLLRPLGLVARWPVIAWLLERAYRRFLRYRPTLQRWAGGKVMR